MMKYVILILLFLTPFLVLSDIIFSETEWDFGTIKDKETVIKVITVQNSESSEVEIKFISTCDCLYAEPESIVLNPGGKETITLFYNPEEDSGEIEKYLIVQTTLEEIPKALFTVKGNVVTDPQEGFKPDKEKNEQKPDNALIVDFYFSPGCRTCDELIEYINSNIQIKINTPLYINKKNILDPDVFKEYMERLYLLGEEEEQFPAVIINNTVLQGYSEIKQNIKKEIVNSLKEEKPAIDEIIVPEFAKRLTIIPVLASGLLDGINPCAFTTLIALLTALTLAGRRKKEIFFMGTFFTLAVFIFYYLIGLGFFQAIRLADSFSLISIILRWVLFIVLLLFASLSVYDYYLIRTGRSKEMILKLPDFFQKKIKNSIRTHVRSTTLVLSAVTLGFLVSIFELTCTGQVYFPLLTYLVRQEKEMSTYLFLLLYNFGFILPLMIVFFLSYRGLSSSQLTDFFQKNMGKVKIGLSFLFIVLAVLIIVT